MPGCVFVQQVLLKLLTHQALALDELVLRNDFEAQAKGLLPGLSARHSRRADHRNAGGADRCSGGT